jgi:FtsP/CotA-like multicopper oxidase with cupredoxin domain
MNYINRRKFLSLSAGATGSVLLTQCSWASTSMPLPHKANGAEVFTTNLDGLLDVALEARPSLIKLGQQQGNLLTYNGQIPGPRLEAKAGDSVRIRFTNKLSQATNLHYHGLHIPPTGKADNIFLAIQSGETETYEFTLPKNHPSGTFFYHPHVHETVAEQVFGGLGGIFIVRGALDEIPEIRAAKEEFLFLKDFALDANGKIPSPNHMDVMRGREGAILTVNGQVNPTFSLASGGLLRFRIINASTSRFYRLSLEDHPFYLIATDGGAIAEPVELKELLLSPGERAEVLIRGDRTPKQYRLLNLPYDRGGLAMMGGMMMDNSLPQQSTETQVLATITYKTTLSKPLLLPQKLITVEVLPQPIKTRRIEMSMTMGMQTKFLFNGKTFDINRVDETVKLGTTEDWEIANVDPDGMEHPFHLHINPFQVIDRNGKPDPYQSWKDTLRVGGKETVRIRIPFRDFAGKTVYHCHILDHEDLGMMGIVDMQA